MRIGVPDIGVKERIEYLASSFLWRSFAVANISGTSWNVSPNLSGPVAGLNRDTGERRTAAYALGPYSVVDTGEFRKSF